MLIFAPLVGGFVIFMAGVFACIPSSPLSAAAPSREQSDRDERWFVPGLALLHVGLVVMMIGIGFAVYRVS